MSAGRVVQPARLRSWMQAVFVAAGLPEALAGNSADVLGYASSRGIDSHGVLALPRYLEHLASERLNAAAQPEQVVDQGAVVRMDGHLCLGIAAGPLAMRTSISKAKQFGVGLTVVHNSSHFGAAGYYTHLAAEHGMIGLSASNVEAMMPAFGGREKLLGNNPFSIGAPGQDGQAHLIDICTSEVAWGKLQLAAAQGKIVPKTWSTDADGIPTTDPEVGMAGMLSPLAGHKGSGLAFMLEAMTSVLAGATPCHEVSNEIDLSQIHIAIDVGAFRPLDGFKADMSRLSQKLRSSRPAVPGTPVMTPGDPEAITARHRQENGIDVPPAVVRSIEALSQQFELNTPWA